MEYQILKYTEGIFELNPNFTIPKEKDTEVSVRIAPVVLFKDGTDVIGLQLTLFYRVGEAEVLRFGFVASIAVSGWEQLVANNADSGNIADELREPWNAVINYGRDALDSKLKDSDCEGLIIPDIPAEQLRKVLRIEKIV